MISAHISYKEAVYSRTATRLDIDNNPDDMEVHRKTLRFNQLL